MGAKKQAQWVSHPHLQVGSLNHSATKTLISFHSQYLQATNFISERAQLNHSKMKNLSVKKSKNILEHSEKKRQATIMH